MTVTEAPRAAAPEAAPAPSLAPAPSGLAAVVGSGDPRTIGKLFVSASLLFLLVSGVAGALASARQTTVDITSQSDLRAVAHLTTLHATAGLFLGVLPLLLGLATAVVPLQIGASTVAFPRASAAAFWTWLVAGGIAVACYALGGGPYAPASKDTATSLYIAALGVVVIALAVATVSVVTTVLTLRAPGMSLRRTPLFSWSIVVGGTVWLLTLPVLAAVMLLVYVDLQYGQQFLGGSDGVYDRIAWVFWQPTLYVVAVPALGIIADIVPVFARRRHHRHAVAMGLVGLFGALSFGAWAQIGFSVDGQSNPTDWLYDGVWIAVGFLAIVPVVGLLGLWAATLAGGGVRMGTPLILALFAGLLIGGGVAAGAVTVIEEVDVVTTTWASGQELLVVAGALVAAAAGLAFWAPKIYGKLLPDGPVRLGATLLTLGAGVAALAYGVAGLYDQPRAIAASLDAVSEIDTVETLNLVAAVGLVVAVVGGLAIVAALAAPARRRTVADDPWGGHTLEWTTTSPPPVGNFAALPEITSEAPLYDARYAAASAGPAERTEATA